MDRSHTQEPVPLPVFTYQNIVTAFSCQSLGSRCLGSFLSYQVWIFERASVSGVRRLFITHYEYKSPRVVGARAGSAHTALGNVEQLASIWIRVDARPSRDAKLAELRNGARRQGDGWQADGPWGRGGGPAAVGYGRQAVSGFIGVAACRSGHLRSRGRVRRDRLGGRPSRVVGRCL
jgi:hypothetical protein